MVLGRNLICQEGGDGLNNLQTKILLNYLLKMSIDNCLINIVSIVKNNVRYLNNFIIF